MSRVACQLVEQKRRKRYPGRVGRGAFSLVFYPHHYTFPLYTGGIVIYFYLLPRIASFSSIHNHRLLPDTYRHLLDPLNLLGVLQALRRGRVSILPAILDVHICNLSSSVSHTSRRNACMPHGTTTEPNVKYYTFVSSQYAIALLEIM